ncbi:MAG: hypothetical protein ACRCX8_18585 [Sarcina sp.]
MTVLEQFYEGMQQGFEGGSVFISFTIGLAFGIAFICSIILLATIILRKDVFEMAKSSFKAMEKDIEKEMNKDDFK